MKIGVALVVLGLMVIAYSLQLDPYTDEQLFDEEHMRLATGSMDSEAYWKVREELLKPKFQLEDAGATVTVFGGLWVLLAFLKYRAPSQKWQLVTLGLCLPFVTVFGFIFDLFLGMARSEFPSWADSLGIPLMGVPVQLVILLGWVGVHLALLRKGYLGGVSLRKVFHLRSWWFISISGITGVLTILLAAEGAYMYVVPGALWVYFYISLAAGREGASYAQQAAPADA